MDSMGYYFREYAKNAIHIMSCRDKHAYLNVGMVLELALNNVMTGTWCAVMGAQIVF